MSRGRNHKENFQCMICKNIKTENMVFKKGYKPSENQKKKQSETRKKLILEGKIDMKKQMNKPEIKNKISKTNKRRMKKIIHHINGNHEDNRPENLREISQSEHFKLHWKQGDIKRW